MAVVVWGAGAIGGVVGAWMARAGADVLLVDRDEAHVRAIRDRGLLVDGVRGELRVRPPAALPAEVEGLFDLVFLAVKCLHTEAALDALVPHLAPDGAVVSLQNGLNEEVIAARIGAQRTVGCFVNFGADWQAPGHIQHGGEHPIYVGELDGSRGERIERIRSLLAGSPAVERRYPPYSWETLRGELNHHGGVARVSWEDPAAGPSRIVLVPVWLDEAGEPAWAEGTRAEVALDRVEDLSRKFGTSFRRDGGALEVLAG